jgi:hypothetical protein
MSDPRRLKPHAGGIQQVFLLEGGASGGLILTANRMQHLPPWPEGVALLLSSMCALLLALPSWQAAGLGTEAERLLEEGLAEAGRQLESCTGRLELGSTVVYLGKTGSFVCGPVPWTVPESLTASRLAPPAGAGGSTTSGQPDQPVLT